jgi:hypothetical protein
MLGTMAVHGRTEALVHLRGLMRWYRDDLRCLSIVVENLLVAARELKPEKAGLVADVLVGELRRVKSSNTTRGYLGTVLDRLTRLPPEIALPRLAVLAADRSFSHKMRTKFKGAAESLLYR